MALRLLFLISSCFQCCWGAWSSELCISLILLGFEEGDITKTLAESVPNFMYNNLESSKAETIKINFQFMEEENMLRRSSRQRKVIMSVHDGRKETQKQTKRRFV